MEEDNESWLLEHLFYEWSMLNYTIGRVASLQSGNEWNSQCESFCVHARLIGLFLTNNDTGNYGAKDFVRDFRSRMPDSILRLKNKIDPQIMHLSRKRTHLAECKLNSHECVELFGWLADQFQGFLKQLPKPVQEKWDRNAGRTTTLNLPPTPSQATNYTTSVSTAYYNPWSRP